MEPTGFGRRRRATDYFPDSVQIVDWYHATEYLAKSVEALYPTQASAAQCWQRERRNDLFLGQPQKITEPLERAGLSTPAEYFHKHARRMHASRQEFHEQGYPIGSGTIESSIKRFNPRIRGGQPPSACWSFALPSWPIISTNSGLPPQTDHHWKMHPLP